jgi:hypothetical protein
MPNETTKTTNLDDDVRQINSLIGQPCSEDCDDFSCEQKREAQKALERVAELARRYKDLCDGLERGLMENAAER